tara:strand:+ start:128 stop:460 length:333 start_codon:yes stop_codon:yes gene_type:complete
MSIDPADYWMTPDEERKLEDKLADRRVHYLEANEYIVDGDESLNNGKWSKAEKEIENLKKTDAFYEWWDAVGSSIRPKFGQDTEEHVKRIALAAWQDRGLRLDNTNNKAQ